MKLKVYAPTGDPNVWFLRSQSTAKGPNPASTLNTYTEASGIPIEAGDHIGVTSIGGTNMGCIQVGTLLGDTTKANGGGGGDTVLGNNTLSSDGTFIRADVEAIIEPVSPTAITQPVLPPPTTTPTAITGKRAAATRKCKKKFPKGPKRKKCIRKANKLPL